MAAHVFLLMVLLVAATSGEDRLQAFYDRIKKDDVVYCKDKTMLLPACTECIPGLKKDASGSCKDYIPDSHAIREEIRGLTLQRYGDKMVPNRPFGLYPCKKTLFRSSVRFTIRIIPRSRFIASVVPILRVSPLVTTKLL